MSLVVTSVVPGSVAERKGLKPGAVILQLSADVRGREPVTLWWARGGRTFGPHRLARLTDGPVLKWEVARGYRHLSMGLGESLLAGWVESRETLMGTTVLIRRMLSGGASASNVMGPLGIVGVAYQSAQEGLGHMLWLLGLIGVSLAFFNLLPIPVLDGGHMVFLVYELITRRPPPPRLIEIAQYAGLLLILGLFVFVFYNDIHRMLVGR
jgi:RIP metalloprotease RseP